MSSEDEYQPPDPNVISFEKRVQFPFPSSQPWTSEDQVYNLWSKEFKFAFRIRSRNTAIPLTEDESFILINKSSGAVWIHSRFIENGYVKLLPGESLRIVELVVEFNNGTFVDAVFEILLGIDYHPEPSLHQDLLDLRRDMKFTDFKLKFGQEEVSCHKAILASRSSVLADAFDKSDPTNQLELEGFHPPNGKAHSFGPDSLQIFLDAVYTGKVATGTANDSLKVLADYLNIELIEERSPELKPYTQEPFGADLIGDLQTLQDWGDCSFPLLHDIQIEPSFGAKNVELTWIINNYRIWRQNQQAESVLLPEEQRISFLGNDLVFGCRHEWNDGNEKAFLVNKGERRAIIRGLVRSSSSLEILQQNSFREVRGACRHQGDDLVVSFKITLLEFLDLDHQSPLQRGLRGLLEDCLKLKPEEAKESKFTDFKLCCGGEKFPCHKGILAARSPTFAKILDENPDADEQQIQDSLPAKVKQMLEFVYSGTTTGEADLDLLRLAKKHQINGLITFCGRGLAKTLSVANVLDLFAETYNQSDDALKNLRASALCFIIENFSQLRKTDQWRQRDRTRPMEDDILNFFGFQLQRFLI